MSYNERLMTESLQGNDDSLKELKYNAGSGNCEAQYFLAKYYANACGHLHDPNYHYWLEKSKENGYVPGVGDTNYYEDGARIDLRLIWDGFSKASHLLSLVSFL